MFATRPSPIQESVLRIDRVQSIDYVQAIVGRLDDYMFTVTDGGTDGDNVRFRSSRDASDIVAPVLCNHGGEGNQQHRKGQVPLQPKPYIAACSQSFPALLAFLFATLVHGHMGKWSPGLEVIGRVNRA